MKIHTFIEIDIASGHVDHDESFNYTGPVALCDRSLTARGKEAQQQAAQAASGYGGEAATAYGAAEPTLARWTTSPPGYGPQGLGTMETRTVQAAKSGAGAAEEAARLRALRTGNEAMLGGLESAQAEGGARAAGSAVQDILAKNEMLKEQQRMAGMKGLTGLYGEGMRGNIGAMGIEPSAINAATAAQKVGWLQNLEGIMAMGQGLGAGASGASTIAKMLRGK